MCRRTRHHSFGRSTSIPSSTLYERVSGTTLPDSASDANSASAPLTLRAWAQRLSFFRSDTVPGGGWDLRNGRRMGNHRDVQQHPWEY